MSAGRIAIWAGVVLGGATLVLSIVGTVVQRSPDLIGSVFWQLIGIAPIYLVAVWLVRRRPDHVQARRLLLVATSLAVGTAIEQLVQWRPEILDDRWSLIGVALPHALAGTLSTAASVVLIATYPDGVVERSWQRGIVRAFWLVAVIPLLRLATSADIPASVYLTDPLPTVPNPLAVPALAFLDTPLAVIADGYLVGAVATVLLIVRYRSASAAQRARMRLLAYSLGLGAPLLAIVVVLRLVGLPDSTIVLDLLNALYVPMLLMLPLSIVVGVMKYGLYEIDVLVRRSLVYAALSFGIAIVYIGLAVLPGLAFGDEIPVQWAVLLTIAAALLFQPLRRRLERLADRWVFGAQVNRYQLLTDFGAELTRSHDLAELLPRLVDTVRSGLNAPWVRVTLPSASSSVGEPEGDPGLSVPLQHSGELIGLLECGARRSGYESSDRELLTTLAGQASTAIANAQLSEQLAERLDELARSRARIVAAGDAERRRIERNIHDGVQQQVVALMMNLRLARNQVGRGERSAESALAELQGEVQDLLVDLRELAHGIHPPVLSDGGLIAAVEARTARLPFDVRIETGAELRSRRFDAEVEGAAYFVVCEALTNVAKHAGSTGAQVSMWTSDNRLSVRISDRGTGFVANGSAGTGLTNLRDRVEALGGRLVVDGAPGAGTSVLAELPTGGGGG